MVQRIAKQRKRKRPSYLSNLVLTTYAIGAAVVFRSTNANRRNDISPGFAFVSAENNENIIYEGKHATVAIQSAEEEDRRPSTLQRGALPLKGKDEAISQKDLNGIYTIDAPKSGLNATRQVMAVVRKTSGRGDRRNKKGQKGAVEPRADTIVATSNAWGNSKTGNKKRGRGRGKKKRTKRGGQKKRQRKKRNKKGNKKTNRKKKRRNRWRGGKRVGGKVISNGIDWETTTAWEPSWSGGGKSGKAEGDGWEPSWSGGGKSGRAEGDGWWGTGGKSGNNMPTYFPTYAPTFFPTTETPTIFPTSEVPTLYPTLNPTVAPTVLPTLSPTEMPTVIPTLIPTVTPTVEPTINPTLSPTMYPTVSPTISPTMEPTMFELG